MTDKSLDVFVSNWGKVEENIIRHGKQQLTAVEAKEVADAAEMALENFGNEYDQPFKSSYRYRLTIMSVNADAEGQTYGALKLLIFLLPNKKPSEKKKKGDRSLARFWPMFVRTFKVKRPTLKVYEVRLKDETFLIGSDPSGSRRSSGYFNGTAWDSGDWGTILHQSGQLGNPFAQQCQNALPSSGLFTYVLLHSSNRLSRMFEVCLCVF